MTYKTKKLNTVMLIDDDPVDNEMNRKIIELSTLAFNIKIFQSPVTALEYLFDSVEEKEGTIPDLILLDLRMPKMDGFGFLDAFSELPDKVLDKSKVFILTASLDEREEKRALQYDYVKGYLQKPLAIPELLKLLYGKEKEEVDLIPPIIFPNEPLQAKHTCQQKE